MSTRTRQAPSRSRRPDAPRLERRILDAARRLYFADGPDGVSARKIASAVGVSPTAIYLHYRGMDDVLHALRMEGHGKLAEYLRAVDPTLPALDRLRQMGRAYHRFGLENRHYYELMFLGRGADAPRREIVQQELFTLMMLRDAVTSGIGAGQIRRDRDAMIVTTALWTQVHGVTALAVSGLLVQSTYEEQVAVLEGVFDAMRAWLTPR
ncbi:MAG: TetR/AcrR family transcriptional regulator [Candidatus Binatia bacterium]